MAHMLRLYGMEQLLQFLLCDLFQNNHPCLRVTTEAFALNHSDSGITSTAHPSYLPSVRHVTQLLRVRAPHFAYRHAKSYGNYRQLKQRDSRWCGVQGQRAHLPASQVAQVLVARYTSHLTRHDSPAEKPSF